MGQGLLRLFELLHGFVQHRRVVMADAVDAIDLPFAKPQFAADGLVARIDSSARWQSYLAGALPIVLVDRLGVAVAIRPDHPVGRRHQALLHRTARPE